MIQRLPQKLQKPQKPQMRESELPKIRKILHFLQIQSCILGPWCEVWSPKIRKVRNVAVDVVAAVENRVFYVGNVAIGGAVKVISPSIGVNVVIGGDDINGFYGGGGGSRVPYPISDCFRPVINTSLL